MNELVSVIIPRDREDEHVLCMHSLLNQDYPKNRYEIIIVSHKKFNDTIENNEDKKIKLLFVKKNNPNIKRNYGAKKSFGKYLFFLDDDAIPPKNWIRKTAEKFEGSDVDIVAGPNIGMLNQNLGEEISDILLRSAVGSGNRKKFKKGKEGFADAKDFSSCNMAIKRNVFNKLGGFDEASGFPGEDTELLFRAKQKKYKFYYSPDLAVRHKRRKFPIQHMKQLFSWGKSNGIRAIKNPKMFGVHDILLPPIIVLFMIALFILLPLDIFVFLLIMGFIFIFAFTLFQEGLRNSVIFTLAFPFHFLSYALGLICGMISGLIKR